MLFLLLKEDYQQCLAILLCKNRLLKPLHEIDDVSQTVIKCYCLIF